MVHTSRRNWILSPNFFNAWIGKCGESSAIPYRSPGVRGSQANRALSYKGIEVSRPLRSIVYVQFSCTRCLTLLNGFTFNSSYLEKITYVGITIGSGRSARESGSGEDNEEMYPDNAIRDFPVDIYINIFIIIHSLASWLWTNECYMNWILTIHWGKWMLIDFSRKSTWIK